MQSLIRFSIVMAVFIGTVFLWKSDDNARLHFPPAAMGKGQDSQDEVARALRPFGFSSERGPWSKQDFQNRIDEAFRRNDPCAIVSLFAEEAPVSSGAKIAAGMAVLFRRKNINSPLLAELFSSENSPLMGKNTDSSELTEVQFLNAMSFSNQLEGGAQGGISFRNVEKAVFLFKSLVEKDPDNGIHSFFLSQALRLMGAKKEEVESAYYQAAKAPRFDPYLQTAYDQLLELSYDNLATFTWVYLFLQKAPVFDYGTIVRNLRNWSQDSQPGKWTANRLAKRLIDLGSKNKLESPGYLYSQAEFILGYSLRYAIEGKQESDREDYLKRMREARESISEVPKAVEGAETELYQEYFSKGKKENCRWGAWQSLFDAYLEKRKK